MSKFVANKVVAQKGSVSVTMVKQVNPWARAGWSPFLRVTFPGFSGGDRWDDSKSLEENLNWALKQIMWQKRRSPHQNYKTALAEMRELMEDFS